MSFVHGKGTVVTLNAKDLSTYCNKSSMKRGGDVQDVTTYGFDDHVFQGGLKTGDASLEGIYDSSASNGPRGVIEPVLNTVVVFTRKPEGTGAGKPLETCNVLVTNYQETNPVSDYISWSVDLKVSGPVALTTQ